MLRDDIARYTELSGEDGEHTSIQRIGAYLDGYDQGKKDCGRPKGEWIYAKEQLKIVPMWECSCCRIRVAKKFNFCPHCGADMRGGTENE